jgi:hypothetical protein
MTGPLVAILSGAGIADEVIREPIGTSLPLLLARL